MQSLEAKAKAQMTDEEYQEFKELYDKLKDTDHDLWVAWQVMFMIDVAYASGELFFLTGFKILRYIFHASHGTYGNNIQGWSNYGRPSFEPGYKCW